MTSQCYLHTILSMTKCSRDLVVLQMLKVHLTILLSRFLSIVYMLLTFYFLFTGLIKINKTLYRTLQPSICSGIFHFLFPHGLEKKPAPAQYCRIELCPFKTHKFIC